MWLPSFTHSQSTGSTNQKTGGPGPGTFSNKNIRNAKAESFNMNGGPSYIDEIKGYGN